MSHACQEGHTGDHQLALFRKKSDEPNEAGGAGEGSVDAGSPGSGGLPSDSARAAKFYKHAQSVHDTGNYEYAMTLWLQGLRQDPASQTGLELFMKSALDFAARAKKPGATKDQLKNFDGKDGVDRYLRALLVWGARPADVPAGMKAIAAGTKLGVAEGAYWIGERVLNRARGDEKPKKETFVKLKDLFLELGAYDLAVQAGNDALSLDRTDTALEAQLRNLSAQATMTSGGYDATGDTGGFRKNIRDDEEQRLLEEGDRIVKTEDAQSRLLAAAKQDYEARPSDSAAVLKYANALIDGGTSAGEKLAMEILLKAHKDLSEFRFRQKAGDVQLRRARRKLRQLREAAKNGDADAEQTLEQAETKYIEMEIKELELCVHAYPTDLGFKFQLGKRHFTLENYDQAIEYFQQSQNDAKSRFVSQVYLGQAFDAVGWHTEAVETLRGALQAYDSPDDNLGIELRYALMTALLRKAADSGDIADAQEAGALASGIAMRDIGYKDIRAKRDQIKQLVTELKAKTA